MKQPTNFDVIIVGGSYAGLAAAMALGRALRNVLVIDGGNPCNKQTPHSHNFLTNDGKTPKEIASLAKQQVQMYGSVSFLEDLATAGLKTKSGFEIKTQAGKVLSSKKLVFASGIRDVMPSIPGFAESWGISVLHCPYCHGYEVRHQKTGILGNGVLAFDFVRLISNWTNDLTLFTNGASTFTTEQKEQLVKHHIEIVETAVERLEHINGQVQNIIFNDNSKLSIKALYALVPFEQHCTIPQSLGCQFTEEGYVKVDTFLETTISGVFACGDNASTMRSVANAVAMGTTAGMLVSKKMILEEF